MRKLLIPGLVALMTGASMAPAAEGQTEQCRLPAEAGKWININPQYSDIASIELTLSNECLTSGAKRQDYEGPTWFVSVIGRCGNEECVWGRVGGEQTVHGGLPFERPSGSQNTEAVNIYPIFATFSPRGERKNLYIYLAFETEEASTVPVGSIIIRAREYTDYPGMAGDKTEDLKFRRQGSAPYRRSYTLEAR